EAACRVTFDGRTMTGQARLETAALEFRGGQLRLSIPFTEVSKLSARDGTLSVTFTRGTAIFELGAAAARWAHKIQHPPSRLEKIGVKPEWKAPAIGVDDERF